MVGQRTNNTSARTAAAPHPPTDVGGMSYLFVTSPGMETVATLSATDMDRAFTADQWNLLRGGATVAINQSRIVDLIALARAAAG